MPLKWFSARCEYEILKAVSEYIGEHWQFPLNILRSTSHLAHYETESDMGALTPADGGIAADDLFGSPTLFSIGTLQLASTVVRSGPFSISALIGR